MPITHLQLSSRQWLGQFGQYFRIFSSLIAFSPLLFFYMIAHLQVVYNPQGKKEKCAGRPHCTAGAGGGASGPGPCCAAGTTAAAPYTDISSPGCIPPIYHPPIFFAALIPACRLRRYSPQAKKNHRLSGDFCFYIIPVQDADTSGAAGLLSLYFL